MIRISTAHLEQINAQAEEAYPGECCGLLVGRVKHDGSVTVSCIAPSPNVAQPPDLDRFEVDPKIRFDLMRALEGSDEVIVGHYHSHPDQTAEPSATDLNMAFEPDLVWLITAVASGKAKATRAWRLNRETRAIAPLTLEISENA